MFWRTSDRVYMQVSVGDRGSPQLHSQALVIIKVFEPLLEQREELNETNHAPTFTDDNQRDFAISEGEAIGHIVTLLKTEDEDFDVMCMHVVNGDSDGQFAVYEGALRIARQLAREKKSKYLLTVAVTDGIDSNYLNVSLTDYTASHAIRSHAFHIA